MIYQTKITYRQLHLNVEEYIHERALVEIQSDSRIADQFVAFVVLSDAFPSTLRCPITAICFPKLLWRD